MPRTTITVQNVPSNAVAITPTYVAVDATNDMMFTNDGLTILYIKNAGASPTNVTIVSVPDIYGRLGDVTFSVPAGSERLVPCFSEDLFNQKTTDAGKIYVNFDTATSVTIGAFKINRG